MARYDQAYTATDKRLKEMEKHIRHIYGDATKEVEEKLKDHMRRYEIKDKKWREWVADGKKTRQQYREWEMHQLAIGKRWEQLRDRLARTYVNADRAAYAYINKNVAWIYAENFNYATYTIEHTLNIDTSFTLYDEGAVMRLMEDDPDMLPPPSPNGSVAKDIREGKAFLWNRQHLQSVMVQGIIQGKSVIDIAKHLARVVGESDEKAAIRNARTMTTAAQNAGRLEGFLRAQYMGIEIEKEWMATLDDRTRHSHRMLDGEVKPLTEKFSNKCMMPADPEGEASEVYNCRCTMVARIKGFENDFSELALRDTSHMSQGSYDEWKKGKAKSQPINKPIKVAQEMRERYLAEYRGYRKPTQKRRTATKARPKPVSPTNTRQTAKTPLNAIPRSIKAPVRPRRANYPNSDDFQSARKAYRKEREALDIMRDEWIEKSLPETMSQAEFAEWCKGKGILIYGDITGVDGRALRAFTTRMDDLSESFPQVMKPKVYEGKEYPFEFGFEPNKVYEAEASQGFKYGANGRDMRELLRNKFNGITSGNFVYGDGTINSLYDHEFGHNVYQYLRDSMPDAHGRVRLEQDVVQSLQGKKGMSDYATANDDELFAEAFAAWYGGERTEFAKSMGDLLKRYKLI